jgi:hypothetical protein
VTAKEPVVDQTYNRVDLATELLEVALWLFLEKNSFVCALMLSGAAEAILGKVLSDSGKQNSLDSKYEAWEPIHTMLYGKPLSKEDFIRDENRPLIAVTHLAPASEPSVILDLEEEACRMLVRGCDNARRLGLPRTAKMDEFDDWFQGNEIGVEPEGAF